MSAIPGIERPLPVLPGQRREYPHSQSDGARDENARQPGAKQAPALGHVLPSAPPAPNAPEGARGRIVNTFADCPHY